ncbi:MAG: hypothetical protein AAGU27_16955 [Dehalobacterium sp.]
MGNEKEKKGLFEFFSGKKAKKGSCCCGGFEIEELPEKDEKEEKEKTTKDKKDKPCC